MKILLASGIENLDKALANHINNNENLDITVASEVYYREALKDIAEDIDVVLISEELPGDNDDFIGSTIYPLRQKGVRVILLPGNPESEEARDLVRKCTPLGVYDYVYNQVTIKALVDKILNPSTIKDTGLTQEELEELEEPINEETDYNKVDDQSNNKTKEKTTHKHGFFNKWFKSDKLSQEDDNQVSFKEEANKRPVRVREGRPVVVLGLGSQQLDDWFNNTFSDVVDINAKSSTTEELTQSIEDYKPDIVVLMRHGPMGGIPDAASLAEESCHKVPAVLFIAGELDEHGTEMETQIKSAGGYVLSCPQGETISGDELVFLMQSIVRDLSEVEVNKKHDKETTDNKTQKLQLDGLKKSAASLSKIFKEEKSKPKLKERIKYSDGLSFDEDSPIQQYSNNVKNPTAIVAGGLFAVVTPWRPALAGRLAASAANILAEEEEEVAVIGASGHSTVSLWLDITEDELMMSDWRVPGSQAPIVKDNFKIWAVDPAKALHTNISEDILMTLKEARKTATYTVMDFAGDFELAQKAAYQGRAVVLVIVPGGDPVESKTTMLWLNRFMEGKNNIIPGIDLRGVPPTQPKEFKPKVIVRNNPADALKMALKKNLDEFVWS